LGLIDGIVFAAACVLFGAGMALSLGSNPSSGEFLVARGCFILAGLLFAGVAIFWLRSASDTSIGSRLLFGAVSGAIILAGTFWMLSWVDLKQGINRPSSTPSLTPASTATAIPIPIVLVSKYQISGVPISVRPDSVIYVFAIRKEPTTLMEGVASLLKLENLGDKPFTWPSEDIQPKRKPKEPKIWPEFSWRCEFKNLGPATVTETILIFRVHLGDTYRDVPVTIGALGVGETFTIWLVNETDQAAWVDRPTTIKAKVAGEIGARNIPLTPGVGNIMDLLPDMNFVPTQNKWPQ
jgi:hypothetical protein